MNDDLDMRSFLRDHEGERHLCVIQDYPDPDALGSAFTHQLICREYEIELDIIFDGEISHQENKALVNLLGLELVSFHNDIDLEEYDGAVFIDNQGTTAPAITEALEENQIPALMVIDHHEPQDTTCSGWGQPQPYTPATFRMD